MQVVYQQIYDVLMTSQAIHTAPASQGQFIRVCVRRKGFGQPFSLVYQAIYCTQLRPEMQGEREVPLQIFAQYTHIFFRTQQNPLFQTVLLSNPSFLLKAIPYSLQILTYLTVNWIRKSQCAQAGRRIRRGKVRNGLWFWLMSPNINFGHVMVMKNKTKMYIHQRSLPFPRELFNSARFCNNG